jgi:xanthine dehydrogenase iron-sulfur cluster and FAD-binding subunit A
MWYVYCWLVGWLINSQHPLFGLLEQQQNIYGTMHIYISAFCTPGIIVRMYTLLAKNPTVDYVEEHLDGNLCRCTGYRPLWDVVQSLCDDGSAMVKGPCGISCRECPERSTCEQDCNIRDRQMTHHERTMMTMIMMMMTTMTMMIR